MSGLRSGTIKSGSTYACTNARTHERTHECMHERTNARTYERTNARGHERKVSTGHLAYASVRLVLPTNQSSLVSWVHLACYALAPAVNMVNTGERWLSPCVQFLTRSLHGTPELSSVLPSVFSCVDDGIRSADLPMGHNYIGHNYTGHSYIGHSHIGHYYWPSPYRP